jgi:hypothetical protein
LALLGEAGPQVALVLRNGGAVNVHEQRSKRLVAENASSEATVRAR